MNFKWTFIIGALLLAAIVGAAAYSFGVSQGIARSGRIVAVAPPPAAAYAPPPAYPYPYPYYGYRPWGLGFILGPIFFIFFCSLILRVLFWRHYAYGYGCGRGSRFEEWHRRMHERMETPQT